MTDNEIIKALECCKELICKDCPIFPNSTPVLLCKSRLEIEALDLIKRQQAEIERLKEREENISIICKRAEEKHHQLYEESKDILIRQAKFEAVGEFAERLKVNMISAMLDGCIYKVITEGGIDYCVEEVVGDT